MGHLEIKRGPFAVIRTVIAILNIAAGAVAFIVSLDSDKIIVKIASVFIVFFGIYLLSNGFGLERCWFRTGNNSLIIKKVTNNSEKYVYFTFMDTKLVNLDELQSILKNENNNAIH